MVERRCNSLFVWLFMSFILLTNCSDTAKKHRVNIILVGATGDLAKRYLWQGFFNLFLHDQNINGKTTFQFYGAARLDQEKGNITLKEILKTSVKCSEDNCEGKKDEFLKNCAYLRLKSEKDYEELQDILEGSLQEDEVEVGRLFYFSVPPFAYEDISGYIDSKCRPKEEKTWLRVVLEKPFGSDFKTAQALSKKLSKYLKEEEIYRIDHYLGKSGVRQITQFRNKNKLTYEKIWNRDFIEQVKIVVKERRNAEGRMNYYDHYGVIRDVFQNHLTELLVLIASELPENNSEITINNSKKSKLLKALREVTLQDAIFGQYKEYNNQLRKEISKSYKSNTPTFSAVLMHIDNRQWFGVPFVLMSGKSLDTRLAYVQIHFKRNAFCIASDFEEEPKSNNCEPKVIVFYIQGGDLKSPHMFVSRSLPRVSLPVGWENVALNMTSFSLLQPDKVVFKPPSSYDAYSSLIQDVFHGNKNMFVGIDDLLLSWKAWTPLLEMSALVSPRLYSPDKIEDLDFELLKGMIKFISDTDINECKGSKVVEYNEHQYVIGSRQLTFRGNKLISGPTLDVVKKLANDITVAAQVKVHSNGIFHLALSGGSTPQQLFQILAYSMDAFPWEHTHIWVVDERCVDLTHDQSNFKKIHNILLKYVYIPYVNIHPMPVNIAGRLCRKEDNADILYEQLLRFYTQNGSLDFVVLGAGNDGHTASLFPNENSLTSSKWVDFTADHSNQNALPRMTLTLPMLNRAKDIAVLILGENKKEIVSKLSGGIIDVDNLPITGVRSENGTLSWYIDNNALQVK